MKIRIPLLMLGPYLRPFLGLLTIISGVLTVIFLIASCSAQLPANRETLEKATATFLSFFVFFIAVFVFFLVLGMP